MRHLHLTIENHCAILTFDREGSSANLFDGEVLHELATALRQVNDTPNLQGLMLRSAKPAIFIAGADLRVLQSAREGELAELIMLGQQTFDALAALRIPTVAAIHGACVGGGFELALACDWRVASDAKETRIGLPETNLGILPAWGGSTRLPHLIGLPAALPLILAGKTMESRSAKRKGLIDAVVPREHLKTYAFSVLKRGKRTLRKHPFVHSAPAVAAIEWQARRELMARTRGLYPGPLAALEVVTHAVRRSHQDSLAAERDAIVDLAHRPETTQLMRVFTMQERARKGRSTGSEPRHLQRAAVIGAGIMGAGIAYWLSTRKRDVLLQDIADAPLAKGMESIRAAYEESVKRHVMTRHEAARGLDRVRSATGRVPLRHCDIVIEAAVEDLEIKKRIFADLSQRSSPETILASNTSALPISELAQVVEHPERLIGLHFFNPVHRMQLVEVVRTECVSPETLGAAVAFVRSIGKVPVVVRDKPGFLVNRILMPYLVAAADLCARGADILAVDKAMLDFGMPMGPLRLLDEVGLDVALHVARTLSAAFPERMSVPKLLMALVEKRHFGKKSGTGFYLHRGKSCVPNPAVGSRSHHHHTPADVADQLAATMALEARLCLAEGVVETADDIDLAMILGTGYAPFRGGPMQYEVRPQMASENPAKPTLIEA